MNVFMYFKRLRTNFRGLLAFASFLLVRPSTKTKKKLRLLRLTMSILKQLKNPLIWEG